MVRRPTWSLYSSAVRTWIYNARVHYQPSESMALREKCGVTHDVEAVVRWQLFFCGIPLRLAR
jgi:hypothetical protein